MSQSREWKTIKEYQDILFEFYKGIAKITINRPRYRNAFTPTTTTEISDALYYCREMSGHQCYRTDRSWRQGFLLRRRHARERPRRIRRH